jgi:CheY-like chemotaxis protein
MRTESILVVEDNPINLKLAFDVLEFEGYQMSSAEDAVTARAIIRRTPPDLILMDLALPGMDGLAFTRELKADQATRHIGIVALTAFAMKGDDQKAKEAGCDGYITKPISTRKLPGQVAELLGRRGKQVEAPLKHERPDCR